MFLVVAQSESINAAGTDEIQIRQRNNNMLASHIAFEIICWMNPEKIRNHFLDTFANSGFRYSQPLPLLQPIIPTSFLFSIGFVDVMEAVAGSSASLNRTPTLQRCFRNEFLERQKGVSK